MLRSAALFVVVLLHTRAQRVGADSGGGGWYTNCDYDDCDYHDGAPCHCHHCHSAAHSLLYSRRFSRNEERMPAF